MKFNPENLVANLQSYFTKIIGGLFILTLVWQGITFGIDPAIASPLFATSTNSISKQVTGKAEEVKGSATKSIGKMQSKMEDKVSDVKMKAKDNLTDAKIKVNSNNARVGNTAAKATDKVKNFFGQ